MTRLGAAASVLAPCLLALSIPDEARAQPPGFGGFGGGGPAAPARERAPVDLTGTWVAVVTEDWIERMSPESPGSGSGGGFGFGGFGRGGGAETPPAVALDACAAYAAGGIMRVPGRVKISWQDDDTLLLEYDAGSQRRVLYFGDDAPAPAGSSLQGHSTASWQGGGGGGRGRGGPQAGFGAPADGRGGAAATRWASLRVVTTSLTGGYLLTSRSHYGEGATLTELVRYHSDFGDEYFTVTAVVEENGATSSSTSSTFKKERNDSKFEPTECEIRPL
jgi:hypothetical protein